MQAHRLAFISFGFFVVAASASAAPSPLPEAKPESVGFSVERLKALDAALQQTVDNHQLVGIVTMMARHGKLVEQKTYGQQDLASKMPIQKDTIFRIYSMTKPITGTAMMILYEEGKWKPSDPIAKYVPEFADLKVYKGTDRHGPWTVEAPAHPPTIGELMSHTAGFSYGFFEKVPVDRLYKKAGLFQAASLFAVTDDPIRVGSTVGKGSYFWNGLAGTWFWIDPTNDVVFVGMVQRLVNEPGMPDMESLSRALVYQALVAPAK